MTKTATATKTRAQAQTITPAPRVPTGKGPVISKLPADFETWVVTEASKRHGLMRDQLRLTSGQTCMWRPYMANLAKARKMACQVVTKDGVTTFYFTKPTKTAARS